MKNLKNLIGERIREVRKDKGLLQSQFARHMGCGRSNLSQMENGLFLPTSSFLALLRSKFNVSLDWLFSGEGSMYFESKGEDINLDDFQEYSGDVYAMLQDMKKSKPLMHRVLSDFYQTRLTNSPTIIELHAKKKKGKDD